jgi:hypothetical protein
VRFEKYALLAPQHLELCRYDQRALQILTMSLRRLPIRHLGQLPTSLVSPCASARSGCTSSRIPANRRAQSSRTASTRHLAQQGCTAHRLPIRSRSCGVGARISGSRAYASVSAAELQFGQPVHETHPHLLRAGECTSSSCRKQEE